MSITSLDIKKLRETTGAGMMDCKKALDETQGDFNQAVDWLRKKGLAAAAKKAGRTASEGLVAVAVEGNTGAVIELNSETDFVARNENFQKVAACAAQYAIPTGGDIEKLKNYTCPRAGKKVQDVVAELVGSIGENLNLRRSAAVSVRQGVVASYTHNAAAPGLGKIGVLAALESSGDKTKLQALGKQIAMHIAAARPESLTIEQLPKALVDRERAVLTEQSQSSGKPAEIIAKMVEGRIRKFYEEAVLLEQVFVIDNKTRIKDVIAAAAKEIGAPVTLSGFVRFELGEGVEKEEKDFAAEVAAAAGK